LDYRTGWRWSSWFFSGISNCHGNASKLWTKSEQLQLVTGYALSNDGLWRQHTWVWNPSTDELIEITVRNEKYFGVVLSDEEAANYFLANNGYNPGLRLSARALTAIKALDEKAQQSVESRRKRNARHVKTSDKPVKKRKV